MSTENDLLEAEQLYKNLVLEYRDLVSKVKEIVQKKKALKKNIKNLKEPCLTTEQQKAE